MSRSFFKKGLLALAVAAASVSAHAGPYSSMYVFGDSLSDVGNDAVITGGGVPSTAYYTDGTNDGRFTNGLNYVDQLASRLGLNVTASVLGGTDYAYGGARTTYLAPGLAGLGALSFNQQITQFTSTHGVADSNGLFVLWIGANDMSDAIKARAAGDTAAIGNAINTAMTGIASAIVQLSSRGATNFLIPNLPDLAVTPVGLDKPDIGILDEAFLAEVRNLPERNLAVELLERLLEGEIKSRFSGNVVQEKKFSEMLTSVVKRYQNRSIETAQVIEELIEMAKKFHAAANRGEEMGLTEDEIRFYDALANNESAVRELNDETLKQIAHELTENLRKNITVDWSARASIRAKLRIMVKRILKKYKYPPDQQEGAVELVLRQAEALGEAWA